ncbi:MAG: Arm DNA-binding domain-containing protein, partial [Flavobacteriaceae bacterium]|nr:Arm DNA-binding domain-containing protein [Flavobacteriaceae bacterium]
MRIAFEINSRENKDGRHNVRIRVSDGREVTPIKFSTPINIYKRYWDKRDERVSNEHIEFASVNRALSKYKQRKEYCMAKWEEGVFTLRNVANYMEGVTDYSSVDAFVKSVLSRRKTNVTYTDYVQKLNIIKGHMGIKNRELKFKEINRNFYYELLKKLVDKKLSKSSIKSYSIAIGSILKSAYDEGVIQELPKRPK